MQDLNNIDVLKNKNFLELSAKDVSAIINTEILDFEASYTAKNKLYSFGKENPAFNQLKASFNQITDEFYRFNAASTNSIIFQINEAKKEITLAYTNMMDDKFKILDKNLDSINDKDKEFIGEVIRIEIFRYEKANNLKLNEKEKSDFVWYYLNHKKELKKNCIAQYIRQFTSDFKNFLEKFTLEQVEKMQLQYKHWLFSLPVASAPEFKENENQAYLNREDFISFQNCLNSQSEQNSNDNGPYQGYPSSNTNDLDTL